MESEEDYDFSCGVCFEPFDDPRTLLCSHSMCNECLVGIYRRNPSCPFCRSPFGQPFPGTNQTLLEMARRFFSKNAPNPAPLSVAQESMLLSLPKEVIFEIYKYLGLKELARSALVCVTLRNYSETSWLWRDYCTQHFPFTAPPSKSWKHTFMVHSKLTIGWQSGRPKDFVMTPWRAHSNYINCFDMYKRNVVSGAADSKVIIWNFNSKNPVHTLSGHNGLINAVKFNEVWVLSASEDHTAKVWDITTGSLLKTLPHNGPVKSLFFNDNAAWTASTDGLRCFDVRTGGVVKTISPPAALKVEPGSNNKLISHDNNFVRIYDLKTNALLHQVSNGLQIQCTYFSGEKNYGIGTASGTFHILDVNTGTFTFNNNNTNWSRITTIHGLDNCFVTGRADGDINYWEPLKTTNPITMKAHEGGVNSVQMDEKRIVSGGADMCMKVWNRETKQSLYALLGGSRQERGKNPTHPTKAGCSALMYDSSRIVGVFNSLLRVYTFGPTE